MLPLSLSESIGSEKPTELEASRGWSRSKLENEDDPNVTMNTLMRYADAVDRVILVQLENASV